MAVEVIWKNRNKFKRIILRMGPFHIMCNVLSIIGKRFADAGLRDLAVESGVIAEGSVAAVLDGRQYNRGVRLHKLVYEALLCLVWKSFFPWLEKNHIEDQQLLVDVTKKMKSLQENTSSVTLQAVLEDSACIIILNRFTEFMRILSTKSGDLAAYWMSYIDLVGVLLDLIRASREGNCNWSLHLYSVRAIIPWCFAYDKQNYARYLPMYYSEMTRLVSDYPSVHKHLSEGGFSVQMGINPFGKLPVDQTLEETVNKDTQCPGGTKGFRLNAGATTKYHLTAVQLLDSYAV